MSKKPKNMQALMEELQQSLDTLSNEQLQIEDSIKEYTKAAALIEKCHHCLHDAKLQVKEIDERLFALEDQDGV